MKDITKNYSNGEVTIVWKPAMCIHSEKCYKGLPDVFDPNRKPWIDPEASSTEVIVNQVKQCPSGALSYFMNKDKDKHDTNMESGNLVETIENGPLMVYGNITVKDHSGEEVQKSKTTAFCRCGASNNKPYCDGSHAKVDFKG